MIVFVFIFKESEETDEELKREALLDAKNLVEDISRSKKGRKKRKGFTA